MYHLQIKKPGNLYACVISVRILELRRWKYCSDAYSLINHCVHVRDIDNESYQMNMIWKKSNLKSEIKSNSQKMGFIQFCLVPTRKNIVHHHFSICYLETNYDCVRILLELLQFPRYTYILKMLFIVCSLY